MTPDPLFTLLTGAFGAALIGLLGAWIQTRREHVRWVRQQRFEAYDALIRLAERVRPIGEVGPDGTLDGEAAERLYEALGSARLVGPTRVHEAARAFGEAATAYAMLSGSDDAERRGAAIRELSDARRRLVDLMRRELGMSG